MQELRVEPKFRDNLPPLTEYEFNRLEDNIIQAGKIMNPIVVWKGKAIIIDGHNRYKIAQKYPAIPFEVVEMDFKDDEDAKEYQVRAQLGQRNLTDELQAYFRGKLFEARKKRSGGQGVNQYMVQLRQNDAAASNNKGTAEAIAKELGIGRRTVERAAQFAKGVDIIREVSSEAADKVLSGKSGMTKGDIQAVPEMEPDKVKDTVQDILDGSIKKSNESRKNFGNTSEGRALRKEIQKACEPMRNNEAYSDYTIEDLVEEIRVNGDRYIEQLHRTLEIHNDVLRKTDEGLTAVQNAINKIMRDIREEMPRYEE